MLRCNTRSRLREETGSGGKWTIFKKYQEKLPPGLHVARLAKMLV